MSTTVEKRLQELLDSKDVELQELRGLVSERDQEIQDLESRLERTQGGWFQPFDRQDDPAEGLPLPRLEIMWSQPDENQGDNWSTFRITYSLVYKHLLGHLVYVPLGSTKVGGNGNPRSPKPWEAQHGSSIYWPFRDGVHMHHDVGQLGLQLWARPPIGAPRRLDDDVNWQEAQSGGHRERR